MIRADHRQFDLFAPPPPPPVVAGNRQAARDDWEQRSAAIDRALAANPAERLLWGTRKGYSGNYLEIALLRDGDRWRLSTAYSMPNMGGCGPFGPAEHATRDEALFHALRAELASIARHLATRGDDMYGKRSLWESKAAWCIAQAPPALFGGPDLAAEYQAISATYAAREKLRRAAICAGASDYIGEDGITRPIYSL